MEILNPVFFSPYCFFFLAIIHTGGTPTARLALKEIMVLSIKHGIVINVIQKGVSHPFSNDTGIPEGTDICWHPRLLSSCQKLVEVASGPKLIKAPEGGGGRAIQQREKNIDRITFFKKIITT